MDNNDLINQPPHYKFDGFELIQLTEQLNFNRGNAVKYLARAGTKPAFGMSLGDAELQDLLKAQFYVNREVERLNNARRP